MNEHELKKVIEGKVLYHSGAEEYEEHRRIKSSYNYTLHHVCDEVSIWAMGAETPLDCPECDWEAEDSCETKG